MFEINHLEEDLSYIIRCLKKENKELKESRDRLLKYTYQLEKDLGFNRQTGGICSNVVGNAIFNGKIHSRN